MSGLCADARTDASWRALLLAAVVLAGCGGERTRTYRVDARYRGLEAQRVAVLIAVPDTAMARQPDLAAHLVAATAAAIAGQVAADVVDPAVSIAYQQREALWSLQPANLLYEPLGADRLVVVDLTEYRLRDADHNYLWLGMAAAHVSVYEADARDPANPRFAATISAQFPEDTRIGLVQGQPREIAAGLNRALARNVARLFHDHEVRQ
jgi:hypothetical protein